MERLDTGGQGPISGCRAIEEEEKNNWLSPGIMNEIVLWENYYEDEIVLLLKYFVTNNAILSFNFFNNFYCTKRFCNITSTVLPIF